MENILFDMGLMIIVATFFASITRKLKQPLIPAYVIAGIVIGPVLGIITNSAIITILSEIGIAFLLFIVGLEIDLNKLKNVAFISSVGGLIRMLLLFAVGFIVSIVVGFKHIEAIYVGIILAFSSTMIVVKLLSDRREIDTLHARLLIGMLLMEDFVAIVAMAILSTKTLSAVLFAESFIKIMLLLSATFILSKYAFPKIFKFAAENPEILFLTSLTVCFAFILSAAYLKLSIIIGAFLAGVALGNLPYNIEIIGKIKPLKDFFATIFFVSIGMAITLKGIKQIIIPLVIFIVFIILFKPFITMFICSFFGYKKRPSFLTSISLTQTSEFSLIIVTQGLLLGHISHNVFSLTILLAVITMSISSYFIMFSERIYKRFSKAINSFDKIAGSGYDLEYIPNYPKYDVVLCGYDRIGYNIIKTIKKMKKKVLIVDYNPEVIRSLINAKIPCLYGDVGDTEIIERMNLKNIKMLISTVPQKETNLLLIKKIEEINKKAIVFVTANHVDDALKFYDIGADYVILPHFLGGEHVSVMIEQFGYDLNKIVKTRLQHIKELKHRKTLGHEHPKHHR